MNKKDRALGFVSTQTSLLTRLRDNSTSAWAEFVHAYRGPIVGELEKNVSSEVADEIAQRIFIKLLRCLKTFEYDPTKSFRAYLKTIVGNAIVDYFREQKRQAECFVSDSKIAKAQDNRLTLGEAVEVAVRQQLYDDLMAEADEAVRHRNRQKWEIYNASRNKTLSGTEIKEKFQVSSVANVHQITARIRIDIRNEIKERLLSLSHDPVIEELLQKILDKYPNR